MRVSPLATPSINLCRDSAKPRARQKSPKGPPQGGQRGQKGAEKIHRNTQTHAPQNGGRKSVYFCVFFGPQFCPPAPPKGGPKGLRRARKFIERTSHSQPTNLTEQTDRLNQESMQDKETRRVSVAFVSRYKRNVSQKLPQEFKKLLAQY